MATIGGVSLGSVTSETQTKDSGLFNTPLPYSDSSDSLIMDIFGTGRTITVQGTVIGASKTDIQTFIGNIEAIQNGNQTGSTYVGELITSNKTVLIQTFDWTWTQGETISLSYTLIMIEGSVI